MARRVAAPDQGAASGDVLGREPGLHRKPHERRRAISEAVLKEGAIRIEQLAERFGISIMTVHRDLDDLEARGILRKSRGVATALSSSIVESSDVYRAGQQMAAKHAIAQSAIGLIEPGQSLFLDDSTTVLEVARRLDERAPLTVVTNSLNVLMELRGRRELELVALGGSYYNWCNAFMGRSTNDAIRHLRADVLMMSTAAVTDGMCFFQSPESADVKGAMFESAARRVLLVDHTKFGRRALHSLLPLSAFDIVMVDSAMDPREVDRLSEQGVNVVVAKAVERR